jgi:hypothetical protein
VVRAGVVVRVMNPRIRSNAGWKKVYLVPFEESEEEIFLKTIIPSRKAAKQYRGESNE